MFQDVEFRAAEYVRYELGGQTKWECKDSIGFYKTYKDAVKACNANLNCKFIENEDCSSTEGFELCSSIQKDGKSCAFERKGSYQSKNHFNKFFWCKIDKQFGGSSWIFILWPNQSNIYIYLYKVGYVEETGQRRACQLQPFVVGQWLLFVRHVMKEKVWKIGARIILQQISPDANVKISYDL